MYVYILWVGMRDEYGYLRSQEMASNTLELELQMLMNCPVWVLGSKLRSSGWATSALDCWATVWTPNETLWIWSHGKNKSPSNVDVFNACKEWVVYWWAFIIIISITLISLHTTRQCHWERGEMTGCRKERGTIYLPSLLEAATVTGVYGWMGSENHHREVWEWSPQGNMGSGETFGSWHCAICLPHLCAFWVSIS